MSSADSRDDSSVEAEGVDENAHIHWHVAFMMLSVFPSPCLAAPPAESEQTWVVLDEQVYGAKPADNLQFDRIHKLA